MTVKEQIVHRVLAMPDSDAEFLLHYLQERESSGFLQAFEDAEEVDEPFTNEELRSLNEAKEAIKNGEVVTFEAFLRNYVISQNGAR